MGLNVITPITITDAMIVSDNVPVPDTGDPAAWNSGTTYALKALVYGSDYNIYESLQASNTNKNPLLDVQNNSDIPPVWWLIRNDLGKVSRWQKYDLLRNLKTTRTGSMTFAIQPNQRFNSMGLFGITADVVTVNVTNAGSNVYSKTITTSTRTVVNYYDYFFLPFTNRDSVVLLDIPPYTGAVITVNLSSTTGAAVSLGSFVIGNKTDIGAVRYGAQSRVMNFSRIDRAFDGTAQLLQRRSIPKLNLSTYANDTQLEQIRELRKNLNAIPAVWVGLDQINDPYFEALIILGIYKDFVIDISKPRQVETQIEIEEI